MAKKKSPYFTFLSFQDRLNEWSQSLYDKQNEIILDEEVGTLSESEKQALLESLSKDDDSAWQNSMKVNTKFYTKNAYRELLINKLK